MQAPALRLLKKPATPMTGFRFLRQQQVVKDDAMLNLVKSPGIDKQELAKTIVAISNEASGISGSDERETLFTSFTKQSS